MATATACVSLLGKTPIVVKDCPGFLVNRILTPYVIASCDLIADGADFERIEPVMDAFGRPMGPAYLEDVVGMDTGSHVIDMISVGYPQRMKPPQRNAIKALVREGRLGQLSRKGFMRGSCLWKFVFSDDARIAAAGQHLKREIPGQAADRGGAVMARQFINGRTTWQVRSKV